MKSFAFCDRFYMVFESGFWSFRVHVRTRQKLSMQFRMVDKHRLRWRLQVTARKKFVCHEVNVCVCVCVDNTVLSQIMSFFYFLSRYLPTFDAYTRISIRIQHGYQVTSPFFWKSCKNDWLEAAADKHRRSPKLLDCEVVNLLCCGRYDRCLRVRITF